MKLEESLENERKEKELYYNTLINKNLLSAKESLKNNNFFDKKNNEKLEDLLHLANSELESKSKKINQVLLFDLSYSFLIYYIIFRFNLKYSSIQD